MSEPMMKIIDSKSVRTAHGIKWPTKIPFSMLEAHREKIESFHGQTLERLNQRGGMGCYELLPHLVAEIERLWADNDWLKVENNKLKEELRRHWEGPNPDVWEA